MNKIFGKQIDSSIEMKDKWLNFILKKSRKTSSLDKFWDLVMKEMGVLNFNDLKYFNFFISETFLEELIECDKVFNIEQDYASRSPRTYEEIDSEDYSIYITKR